MLHNTFMQRLDRGVLVIIPTGAAFTVLPALGTAHVAAVLAGHLHLAPDELHVNLLNQQDCRGASP